MGEAQKYLALYEQYCQGNGVDIGSGGEPMVPHAIQIDLPEAEYAIYNAGRKPRVPIQWRSKKAMFGLPFKDDALDWIGASHVLEDHPRDAWMILFNEWKRVLRIGGHMVLIVPDKARWENAVINGQPPNFAHYRECYVGELSRYIEPLGFSVIRDSLTDLTPQDYSILGVFQKQ